MRVLMLGWEFPPHISGGLGTACYGLTQGLGAHDVAIDFVVPRVFGDEDQRYVDLVSCETTLHDLASTYAQQLSSAALPKVLKNVLAALPAPKDGSSAPTPTLALRWLVENHSGTFAKIGVDSLLHPYLTPQSFATRREALQQGLGLADAWHNDASSLDIHATVDSLDTNDVHEDSAPALSSFARMQLFSGHYGTELFTEVARYALAVEAIAAARTFDLIHAHDWMTYSAAIRAKACTGKPLILHLHACEYDRSGDHPNEVIRAIEAEGFAHADRIICVSHYTASLLERRYHVPRTKLRVVHNAVVHDEKAQRRGIKTIDEPIVLFLGRVTFQKGPDYFIEAARKVVAVEPNVKFVMAGDGDMLKAMIERVASYGLATHFHFTGFLRGTDVERMYAMADLYIMPSVSEPFGIAPLEAISLDVPVIVSKQSGVAEILKNALKVDFWDVDELANKIVALLRQPSLRESLIRGGREELRHMQWNQRAEKVLAVYREFVP